MKQSNPNRPVELKAALILALLSVLIGLAFMVVYRAAFGEGWILMFFFRVFMAILYLVLFVLAFNGFGWTRYIYAVLFTVGLGRIVTTDASVLTNIWVLVPTVASLMAIILWFSPNTTRWYRDARAG